MFLCIPGLHPPLQAAEAAAGGSSEGGDMEEDPSLTEEDETGSGPHSECACMCNLLVQGLTLLH